MSIERARDLLAQARRVRPLGHAPTGSPEADLRAMDRSARDAFLRRYALLVEAMIEAAAGPTAPPTTDLTACRACRGAGWIVDYSVPGRTTRACDGCHGAGKLRL